LLAGGCPAAALGQLVIETELVTQRRPGRLQQRSGASVAEGRCTGELVHRLNRLRFSRTPAIASLIRGVLLRALASSPAALCGALRQYRRLLQHAEDASNAGQLLDRSELRHFARQLGDQLIWWELLPRAAAESDIESADLGPLNRLIPELEAATREPDGKLDRLQALLQDGKPSLVFTTSRETVRYLRDRLAGPPVAWCTGERAGIGTCRVARQEVLRWFRDAASSELAPRHLIVTDVAAEGLDLRRAARVIHYDLPWTPMRIEQREGRSIRYGSGYSSIDVVHFEPPPVLERLLRAEAILARKAKLPAQVGLGPAGRHVWRWRAELARRFGGNGGARGVATMISSCEGLLIGFELHGGAGTHPCSAAVLWVEPHGSWSEDPNVIEEHIAMAVGESSLVAVDSARLRRWLALATQPLRERINLIQSRRWITAVPKPAVRRLVERLQLQVREAARLRQSRRLARLERALEFVADGHTAGEDILICQLLDRDEGEILARTERLHRPRSSSDGIDATLSGVIIFTPAEPGLAEIASIKCQTCKPLSSISTEP
jgi:Helicase conserved C-terminal domain